MNNVLHNKDSLECMCNNVKTINGDALYFEDGIPPTNDSSQVSV